MYCQHCGQELTEQQAFCNHCGRPHANKTHVMPPVPAHPKQKKNYGCGCAVLIAIVMGVGIASNIAKTAKEITVDTAEESTVSAPKSTYSGSCGIEATAHMKSDDFINHPELNITIKNVSGKDIAAIKFLAIPFDVYGEEIRSFATQEYLSTDDLIKNGKQKKLHYGPFLLANIKSVKLYVYSVYYTDGSSWGNKDASRSEIQKKGKRVEATFEQ